MCQSPSFVRLLDLFEDEEMIQIVMEYVTGADLYDYFEARDFKLGEERVR